MCHTLMSSDDDDALFFREIDLYIPLIFHKKIREILAQKIEKNMAFGNDSELRKLYYYSLLSKLSPFG